MKNGSAIVGLLILFGLFLVRHKPDSDIPTVTLDPANVKICTAAFLERKDLVSFKYSEGRLYIAKETSAGICKVLN